MLTLWRHFGYTAIPRGDTLEARGALCLQNVAARGVVQGQQWGGVRTGTTQTQAGGCLGRLLGGLFGQRLRWRARVPAHPQPVGTIASFLRERDTVQTQHDRR